jgi:putative ABC transport system substrate-binding protein
MILDSGSVTSIDNRASASAGATVLAARGPLTVPRQPVSRRAALIGIAGALLPSAVYGQKPTTPPRIGWLSAGSAPDPFLDAFREGLRALGYVEGQNVVLDVRYASGNLEALQAGAADLARLKVSLIVASLTAIRAARAIKDIPVVFTVSGDPVEARFVQSLSRPGAISRASRSSRSRSPASA